MQTGHGADVQRKGIWGNPILLAAIILTALASVSILAYVLFMGKETTPISMRLLNAFRCLLQGPMM